MPYKGCMPQQQLPNTSNRPPIVGLQITLADHTLLHLDDATEVTYYEIDIKGGRHYLGAVTLRSVEQDYLNSLLERTVDAWRWSTATKVRNVMTRTVVEARRHLKAHQVE